MTKRGCDISVWLRRLLLVALLGWPILTMPLFLLLLRSGFGLVLSAHQSEKLSETLHWHHFALAGIGIGIALSILFVIRNRPHIEALWHNRPNKADS